MNKKVSLVSAGAILVFFCTIALVAIARLIMSDLFHSLVTWLVEIAPRVLLILGVVFAWIFFSVRITLRIKASREKRRRPKRWLKNSTTLEGKRGEEKRVEEYVKTPLERNNLVISEIRDKMHEYKALIEQLNIKIDEGNRVINQANLKLSIDVLHTEEGTYRITQELEYAMLLQQKNKERKKEAEIILLKLSRKLNDRLTMGKIWAFTRGGTENMNKSLENTALFMAETEWLIQNKYSISSFKKFDFEEEEDFPLDLYSERQSRSFDKAKRY